ncbi:MAG: tRNA (N(6)-L-threonylcarbamoyladenosine(37)-C(2))-methylthiotransferase MtaB [Ruminococcaceae bacterium]|nr:tRNA (N(6)-L-threonylcarbamoyladenosine(37)-C(2))-methylthiotransferase MtaB [Oscillospiraceae bacterium]
MKKFAILTLGCRVNHYESQVLSEELSKLGYESAPFNDKCDVYIVNSCAVTEESVRKSKQMVRRAAKKNPDALIMVCGCASQLHKSDFEKIKEVSFVYGTRNKDALISALKSCINGENAPRVIVDEPNSPLTPTLITRFDRTRAYVKIQDGCENKCAYCIIPKVRGSVVLRPENEIICEVKALADNGCHEVVLTGIETSAYGERLPILIEKIAEIDGIHRIRLGSLEPSFMKKQFVDAIAKIDKVCPHFHISVQNGSDNVLRAMRRRYNVKMLEDNVAYLRSVIPNCNLSADVIVGFPGESEEDFLSTCEFVKRNAFLHLHIFTYSPRPNTEAAAMDNQLPEAVKTERLHRLSAIADEEKRKILTAMIESGKEIKVLCETYHNGYISGHTDGFVECLVKSDTAPEKGAIISVIPDHIEDGKLICKKP